MEIPMYFIILQVDNQTINKGITMNSNNSQNATNSSNNQVKNNINCNNQDKTLQLFPVAGKAVELDFTGDKISSDGGALLLKEIENQIGIVKAINSAMTDNRDQRYVTHDIKNLITQRVFQIACAYEDANDCNSLKNDAVFKLCADLLPDTDTDLASQPTMSRFENVASRATLYRIAEAIINVFIRSYEEKPEVIVLDFDDTNNNVHGGQQLSLYNSYYSEHCFMPLHIYEGISGKLITTILKPSKRSKGIETLAILKRVVSFIRSYWQDTIIVFRGDGHFKAPEIMEWIDTRENVYFVTGLAGNTVLSKQIETTLKSAKNIFKSRKANKTGNKKVKLYHSFYYRADTWHKKQRVIAKVEVSDKGSNIRYIVSDMDKCRARQLYEEIYCARGKMELYIKEHKTYLKSDRTSCNKFEANQFRLFLHSAAYILIHTLQNTVLKHTEFANSTMQTIQLKLLKTAARVKELKTKIKIEFPKCSPQKRIFERAFGIFEVLRC